MERANKELGGYFMEKTNKEQERGEKARKLALDDFDSLIDIQLFHDHAEVTGLICGSVGICSYAV